MKKIAWITDTTATLSKDYIEAKHIHVMPLQIIFGDATYKEEVDITAATFYQKMQTESDLPKSSQPSLGDFVTLYERLKEEYEIGIAIHASSALSGTYQTSQTAAEMVGFPLLAVDSKIGSYPLAEILKTGVQLEEAGKSPEEIVATMRELTNQTELYLLPASLEQLKRSGRLSGTKAILGTLLKMNLIIKFEDGKVVLSEKIRTAKKAKQFLFDLVETHHQEMTELCIIHGDDEATAHLWQEELRLIYPHLAVTTLILCPVAGVHTGYGTLGFSWIKKQAE